MFHGVINIYKEPGFTSHDVVAKLRGILRQKKIGHTGTLDPAAEGVLPVCLGKGTKLCDLLTDKTMTVTCSKGTYIRTLCHDIGEKLGCGGCMEKLIRTRVDRFAIGDSLRLSEVEALAKAGQIEDRIVPVDGMFEDCPAYVSESEVLDKLLQNGNPFPKGLGPRDGCLVQIGSSLAEHQVSADGNSEMVLPDSGIIRVYDSANQFIGLYDYQPEKKQWKPRKIFLGG